MSTERTGKLQGSKEEAKFLSHVGQVSAIFILAHVSDNQLSWCQNSLILGSKWFLLYPLHHLFMRFAVTHAAWEEAEPFYDSYQIEVKCKTQMKIFWNSIILWARLGDSDQSLAVRYWLQSPVRWVIGVMCAYPYMPADGFASQLERFMPIHTIQRTVREINRVQPKWKALLGVPKPDLRIMAHTRHSVTPCFRSWVKRQQSPFEKGVTLLVQL